MGPEIREAQEDDMEAMQEMAAAMSSDEADAYDPTIDPDWPRGSEAEEWFAARIEEGFARVVVEEEVVGYAVGAVADAESYRSVGELAELESMYVRPAHRGQGIGTRLVEMFVSWAERREVERIRVEVTAQNEDGIRFYRSNGFEDYAVTLEQPVDGD